VVNGAFGTNGGVATDGLARVLDVDNRPIPGLFAAGNTTENAYAAGYPGAGATLGPIMTMGYLAGRTIAGQSPEYRAAEQTAAQAGQTAELAGV
jgi:predicted oxidoreductase